MLTQLLVMPAGNIRGQGLLVVDRDRGVHPQPGRIPPADRRPHHGVGVGRAAGCRGHATGPTRLPGEQLVNLGVKVSDVRGDLVHDRGEIGACGSDLGAGGSGLIVELVQAVDGRVSLVQEADQGPGGEPSRTWSKLGEHHRAGAHHLTGERGQRLLGVLEQTLTGPAGQVHGEPGRVLCCGHDVAIGQPLEQGGHVGYGDPHLVPPHLVTDSTDALAEQVGDGRSDRACCLTRAQPLPCAEPGPGVLDRVGGVVQVGPPQQQLSDRDAQGHQRHRVRHRLNVGPGPRNHPAATPHHSRPRCNARAEGGSRRLLRHEQGADGPRLGRPLDPCPGPCPKP